MRWRAGLVVAGSIAAASAALAGERLVIKGSDTIGAELIPPMREAYIAKGHGTTFEIAAEGSTTALEWIPATVAGRWSNSAAIFANAA